MITIFDGPFGAHLFYGWFSLECNDRAAVVNLRKGLQMRIIKLCKQVFRLSV